MRYGIITPYTSFLIDENDILSQSGREEAAQSFANTARDLSQQSSGAAAVNAAATAGSMQAADSADADADDDAAGTRAYGMGGGDIADGEAQAQPSTRSRPSATRPSSAERRVDGYDLRPRHDDRRRKSPS